MDKRNVKNFILGGPLLFIVLGCVAVLFIILLVISLRRGAPKNDDLIQPTPAPLSREERLQAARESLEQISRENPPRQLSETERQGIIRTMEEVQKAQEPKKLTPEERARIYEAMEANQVQ